MEHLFKLKKDSKTVGYEQSILIELLSNTQWAYKAMITQQRFPDGKWFDVLIGEVHLKPIHHDEKCRFVTKDKNGKDVFADDEILVYRGKENIGEGYVHFNERFLWWVVDNSNQDNDRESPQDWSQLTLCDVDIELIEDKDNE